ncbi:MAG: 50S ribosomal protein L25 [Chloroflexi bacterium]|nr:50S ribosomal protein L25 [Chloroflexota bacterium]
MGFGKERRVEELMLQATHRQVLGKKTRFLRRQGLTPAHLYGHDVKSVALQCDTDKLKNLVAHAGRTRLVTLEVDDEKARSVFVREIQRDAISQELLHVDFYQVKRTEKIAFDVPIVLVGEAPAMKFKGRMIIHGLNSLSIECLPTIVPPQIEVDITHLEDIEQAIHVKDIVLDPEITVHEDPEQLVVKVSEVAVKEEVEAAPVVEEAEAVAEEAAEVKAEAPAEEEKPKGPAE